MKKILFIANSTKPKKDIELAEMKPDGMYIPCIEALKEKKYIIYIGINNNKIDYIYEKENLKFYNQMTYRNIFNFKDNYNAYKNINKIIKKENIDIIHCNTPIGGLIGRICGSKNKVNKIIYTVHGFHFFKGNNKLKNIIFKTVERYLAKKTDCIITMNKEDYEAAKKFKLRNNGTTYLTHGVGIDLNKFKTTEINKEIERKKLKLKKDDIVLISIGDLVKNKNYITTLKVIKECNNKKIKLLICGQGCEKENLLNAAKEMNIEDQVNFLGFRKDIKELLNISDIFIFTSKREGLSRALMEAMAIGLPCVVSNIRGNSDLIVNGEGGYLCKTVEEYINAINNITNNKEISIKMKNFNLDRIKKYSKENVINEIKKIYNDIGV